MISGHGNQFSYRRSIIMKVNIWQKICVRASIICVCFSSRPEHIDPPSSSSHLLRRMSQNMSSFHVCLFKAFSLPDFLNLSGRTMSIYSRISLNNFLSSMHLSQWHQHNVVFRDERMNELCFQSNRNCFYAAFYEWVSGYPPTMSSYILLISI